MTGQVISLYLSEGDETEMDKDQKVLERAKKRALSTSMLRELREEFSEGPTEIRVSKGNKRAALVSELVANPSCIYVR